MKQKRKRFRHWLIGVWIVGMLCAGISARKKKPMMHVNPARCVGCYDCYRICPVKGNAVFMIRGKAVIDVEKCIGCLKCIYICSYGAVR